MSDYEKALSHLARNYYNPKFDSYNTLEKVQSLKALRELVDRAEPTKPAILVKDSRDGMCRCGAYLKREYKCCPYCQQTINWGKK